ncbi:MAG: type II toxin-antitoxin system RelE/ParE family toxin [Veillonella sp.]|nr:type II toxin-antitoxin system RelE/ParE family toxin [Veillonella sp.]
MQTIDIHLQKHIIFYQIQNDIVQIHRILSQRQNYLQLFSQIILILFSLNPLTLNKDDIVPF